MTPSGSSLLLEIHRFTVSASLPARQLNRSYLWSLLLFMERLKNYFHMKFLGENKHNWKSKTSRKVKCCPRVEGMNWCPQRWRWKSPLSTRSMEITHLWSQCTGDRGRKGHESEASLDYVTKPCFNKWKQKALRIGNLPQSPIEKKKNTFYILLLLINKSQESSINIFERTRTM